ncbi:MAG: hypothetical protein WD036_10425 [Bauldia sp.]
MTRPAPPQPSRSPLARREDLHRILRDLDDSRLLEILAQAPTVAEIEEAAMWFAGEGAALDRSGHPLTGKTARIYDILIRDLEPPER